MEKIIERLNSENQAQFKCFLCDHFFIKVYSFSFFIEGYSSSEATLEVCLNCRNKLIEFLRLNYEK